MRFSKALQILVFTFPCSESLSLPPTTGPYSVGIHPYVLNHTTLNDPFAPNNISTSILLNFFYPTLQTNTPPSPPIPSGLGSLYEDYWNLPSGSISNITADLQHGAPALPKHLDPCLPTILFGPAFGGPTSQTFTSLLSDLVSHGYTVVSMDHPYEQPFLEYPDGTGVPGLPLDFEDVTEELIGRVQTYRVADTTALLDALPRIVKELNAPWDTKRFINLGHSLGGSAALETVVGDRNKSAVSFLGAINLDGENFGTVATNSSEADLKIPSLLMASEFHVNDITWQAYESVQTTWWKELRVTGMEHTSYSDTVLWKQWFNISFSMPVEKPIEAEKAVEVVRRFVRAFVDMVSQGKGEGVLKRPSEEWPEVIFAASWKGNGTA